MKRDGILTMRMIIDLASKHFDRVLQLTDYAFAPFRRRVYPDGNRLLHYRSTDGGIGTTNQPHCFRSFRSAKA